MRIELTQDASQGPCKFSEQWQHSAIVRVGPHSSAGLAVNWAVATRDCLGKRGRLSPPGEPTQAPPRLARRTL